MAQERNLNRPTDYDVVVVGAGFAGLYSLYRLRARGLRVLVIEAGDDVGGTWYWNRYPGARCDVPSVDYSYSFDESLEQEWVWSERYATQPEILRYIHHVADRFDLRKDVQLGTRVVAAAYDDETYAWRIAVDSGEEIVGRLLVMATGNLSVPRVPHFQGTRSFRGELLHTGSWPREPVSFTDKRVAVIGTGSSGTQLIPLVAAEADTLHVFQRTPNFSVPANNTSMSAQELAAIKADYRARRAVARRSATGLTHQVNRTSALDVSADERLAVYEKNWDTAGFGFIQAFSDLLLDEDANRTAVEFLHNKVREIVNDPRTADLLTATDYPFGSKRPCVDTNFYATFNQNNVRLVDVRSEPIVRVTETGIETEARTYDADVIVLATGFDAMTGALDRIDIRGRDGVKLRDRWQEGPQTYLGLTVSGFPNMFTVTGPGSPSVLTNVLVSIEQHVEFIDELVGHLQANGLREIEADTQAEKDWTQQVNEMAYKTLYPTGNSWYLGPETPGRRRSFMPYTGGLRAYRRVCAAVVADDYAGFHLR